jgi:hypothetical protein
LEPIVTLPSIAAGAEPEAGAEPAPAGESVPPPVNRRKERDRRSVAPPSGAVPAPVHSRRR